MKIFRLLCLLASLVLPAYPAVSQTGTGFPSLEPDPGAALFAAGGRDGYSWEELADIGLWASDPGGEAFSGRLRSGVEELLADPRLPEDPKERGEYILTFMHSKFLKSYSALQTRLDTLLENGRYNCVSSAVLYLILGRAAGLDVRGVMTRTHAFASIAINGALIDVETTNPYGFDPGNRREFHDAFGRVTGFAYVPAGNYRDRSAITPLELVSLILSNRIAELETRRLYAGAVPLAINRAELLEGRSNPSAGGIFNDPRQDLMDRLFNFGASLLSAGREEDALRWAALAGPRYPDGERWQEYTTAAVNNKLVKLIRQKKTAEARAFLDAIVPFLPDENYLAFNIIVLEAELGERAQNLSNINEAEDLLSVINGVETFFPPEKTRNLRVFVTAKIAGFLAAPPDRDWAAAIDLLERALADYGPDRQLEQSLTAFRSNYAAEYHNRFAAAYNGGNYREALRIAEEGLAMFPRDRRLLSDRRTVQEKLPPNAP